MHGLFVKKRDIPAKRWLGIGLRCAHLVGISGLAGAYLFALPEPEWFGYLLLTLISGVLLILKDIYQDPIWLLQLRGQVIIAKLIFLGAAVWLPVPDQFTFLFVIVVSGIIAHAPGKVRYYSVWHAAVLTREMPFPPDLDDSDIKSDIKSNLKADLKSSVDNNVKSKDDN